MLLKFVLIGLVASVSGYTVYKQSNVVEMAKPPTIDRTFNVFYNLYKMFQSWRSKGSSDEASKHQIAPPTGLYLSNNYNRRVWADEYPGMTETNHEEHGGMSESEMTTMMVMMEEKKNPEPQFWLFDKFSDKMDLVVMTRIFLKLIVLKKIVKFVALVGLLFFIPTLTDETIFNNVEAKGKDISNVDFYGKRRNFRWN